MATPNRGISDSHLATIGRRRAAVLNARKSLGMGTEEGAPQASRRAIPSMPPQRVPSRPAPEQARPVAGQPAQAQPQQDPREVMLAKAKAFLDQQKNPGAQPVPEEGIQNLTPAPDAEMTTSRITALGAAGVSPEQQFYRLNGRMPSPREMVVHRQMLLLEQQLNRKPTANELRTSLMRPASLSSGFQPLVGV